ncbi:TcaA 3rd/4th domain-containing protein [Alkalicoccus daliensis]|uniref:Zinc ribbon domain-containing protein n=1 Tax=Alkalicoccus daliensis TaxID=745820 RepID=A0A1H0GBU6_9BACI|nr:hypothetical protein [Alkalicoccus daliensis]SDO04308.1 hypothetical protein SAMN04488053_10648 [Alkalicoccus daliensis]
MSFCNNCGEKRTAGETQCANCGKEVQSSSAKARSKATKKQKVILFSSAASVLVLGGLYFTGSTLADGSRTLNHVQKAILEEDSETLYTYMSSSDPVKEVTEKHAEDIISFYHSSSYTQKDMDEYFSYRADLLRTGDNPIFAEENQGTEIPWVSFEKSGSKYLFFDNYDLVINSFPLYVTSNQNDISFQVDGETVSHDVDGMGYFYLGDFLPGVYEVTASLESDFLDLDVSSTHQHLQEGNTSELLFDVDEIEVTSSMENTALFVDGEDSGMTVGTSSVTIGPVLMNGEMELHAEKESPFGTLQSDVISPESWDVHFEFLLEEEMKETIVNDMQNMFENPDFLYEGYSNSLRVLEEMEWFTEMAEVYEFEGKLAVSIPVTEHWQHNVSWNDEELDMRPAEENRRYTLVYQEDNEEWEIDAYTSDYGERTGLPETLTFDADSQVENAIEQQKENTLEAYRENADSNLDSLFRNFIHGSLNLSNSGNEGVFDYIDEDAEEYRDSIIEYTEYLEDKEISRTLSNYEVDSYDTSDDEFYTVNTVEEYRIYYGESDETKMKEYESTYRVRLTEDGFKVTELEETNEINSEDL